MHHIYEAMIGQHRAVNQILGRTPPEVFYHGTTEEKWQKIQDEGCLFGVGLSYRYTYLSEERSVAEAYAKPVLLEVTYVPVALLEVDNYGFNPPEGQSCWQFSVFIPIPITHVRRLA